MLERNGKHINLTPSGVVKLPIMKLNLKGKVSQKHRSFVKFIEYLGNVIKRCI